MTSNITKQDDMDLGIDMSDMMMIMMMVMMMSLLSGIRSTAASSNVLAQAITYEGIADPRTIHADQRLMWLDLIREPPYRPWVHAYIINDGPAAVQIGINHPTDGSVLDTGETWTVDRSGAVRKIETLFFICPIGGRATIRITGEY